MWEGMVEGGGERVEGVEMMVKGLGARMER